MFARHDLRTLREVEPCEGQSGRNMQFYITNMRIGNVTTGNNELVGIMLSNVELWITLCGSYICFHRLVKCVQERPLKWPAVFHNTAILNATFRAIGTRLNRNVNKYIMHIFFCKKGYFMPNQIKHNVSPFAYGNKCCLLRVSFETRNFTLWAKNSVTKC